MVAEKQSVSGQAKNAGVFQGLWPNILNFNAQSDQLKIFYEYIYSNNMSIFADLSASQDEYLKKLSTVRQPADALACASEFVQTSFGKLLEGAQRSSNAAVRLSVLNKE